MMPILAGLLYLAIFCAAAWGVWTFVPAPSPLIVNLKGLGIVILGIFFLIWLINGLGGVHAPGLHTGPR